MLILITLQRGCVLFRDIVLRWSYPEGTVGYTDSCPGDGDCVFDRGNGRVGTGVDTVSSLLHLNVERTTLGTLWVRDNIVTTSLCVCVCVCVHTYVCRVVLPGQRSSGGLSQHP